MAKENLYKVFLSTKKEVLLREPKIGHREQASALCSGRSNNDPMHFLILMAKEQLRLLIHSIDGKAVSPADLINMDAYFSVKEYSQLEKVIKVLTEDDSGEGPFVPKIEIVPTGDT